MLYRWHKPAFDPRALRIWKRSAERSGGPWILRYRPNFFHPTLFPRLDSLWITPYWPKLNFQNSLRCGAFYEQQLIYGAYNPIWQKQFERGDYHVIWFAFVLRIWQFRTNSFFLFSLRKVDLTDSNCSTFYGFDKFEPIIYVEPFEWFEFVKSVKRRTIWSKFRRENKKNYCFESVKSVKRMHIRSHGNRLFRIVFVKSGCKPRIRKRFNEHYRVLSVLLMW